MIAAVLLALQFVFTAAISPAEEAGSPGLAGQEPSKNEIREGGISPGETLTLDRCIDIALKRNPAIVAAANTVDVNRSRVGEARAPYYPQISAGGAYTKNAPGFNSSSSSSGSTFGSRSEEYSGNITLTQSIIDFKTFPTVNVAKYNLQSSRSDFVTTQNDTVLSVKEAYYTVLRSKRDRDVAADVIKQFELHLEQAKGFYEVGIKAKIDVIKAEVDLSNAKLTLINAENSLNIAWVNLNNAMGVPDPPQYDIEDNLAFQPYLITLEEAVKKAFENRPDLLSAIAKRQAAESNITVARSGYFPVLSGTASYNKAGADTSPAHLGDGWEARLDLTIPLFSGFLTSHQVAEAKSNLYVLKANEESTRNQILLEVRQAFLNLQAAEASISTSRLAVQQAKENLDLANGRYAAGVGSPVEVSDAFATYVTAEANHTTALANYKTAQAAIIKAMGLQ
jgi:TolC family type I secretion outer membrane protein